MKKGIDNKKKIRSVGKPLINNLLTLKKREEIQDWINSTPKSLSNEENNEIVGAHPITPIWSNNSKEKNRYNSQESDLSTMEENRKDDLNSLDSEGNDKKSTINNKDVFFDCDFLPCNIL